LLSVQFYRASCKGIFENEKKCFFDSGRPTFDFGFWGSGSLLDIGDFQLRPTAPRRRASAPVFRGARKTNGQLSILIAAAEIRRGLH